MASAEGREPCLGCCNQTSPQRERLRGSCFSFLLCFFSSWRKKACWVCAQVSCVYSKVEEAINKQLHMSGKPGLLLDLHPVAVCELQTKLVPQHTTHPMGSLPCPSVASGHYHFSQRQLHKYLLFFTLKGIFSSNLLQSLWMAAFSFKRVIFKAITRAWPKRCSIISESWKI